MDGRMGGLRRWDDLLETRVLDGWDDGSPHTWTLI